MAGCDNSSAAAATTTTAAAAAALLPLAAGCRLLLLQAPFPAGVLVLLLQL